MSIMRIELLDFNQISNYIKIELFTWEIIILYSFLNGHIFMN